MKKRILLLLLFWVLLANICSIPIFYIPSVHAAPIEEERIPTATSGTWGNPTWAYTDDGKWAHQSTHGFAQQYYNYGFDGAIPENVVIDSVELGVEYYQSSVNDAFVFRVSRNGGFYWSSYSDTYNADFPGTFDWFNITSFIYVWDHLTDANFRVEVVNYVGGGGSSCYPNTMYFVGTENELVLNRTGKKLLGFQDWNFYNPEELLTCLAENRTVYALTWSEQKGWFVDEDSEISRVDVHIEDSMLYDIYSGSLDFNYTVLDEVKNEEWNSHVELTGNHNISYWIDYELIVGSAESLYEQWRNGESIFINHLWWNYTVQPFQVTDVKTRSFAGKVYNVWTKGETYFGKALIKKAGKTLSPTEYEKINDLKLSDVPIGKFPPFLLIATKEPWTSYIDQIPVKVTYREIEEHLITFYFHNCGTLLVDGVNTANGTQNLYNTSDTFNITGVPTTGQSFLKHVYDGSEAYANPYIHTVSANYTFHTWFASYENYNPTVERLIGSTTQTSGSFPGDVETNDGSYKVFQSFVQTEPYEAEDFVDNNSSNVDDVANMGTHSNFPELKDSDGNYDRITDEPYDPSIAFLNVTSFSNTMVEWVEVGSTPYLDYQDQPTNYIYVDAKTKEEGYFVLSNLPNLDGFFNVTFNSVDLYLYCDAGTENILAWVWDGAGFQDYTFSDSGWGLYSADISGFLDDEVKMNAAQLYFESEAIGGWGNPVQVDHAYIRVNYTGAAWRTDLEIQFTDVPFNHENEYACFKSGDHSGVMRLDMTFWDGDSWEGVGQYWLKENDWKNISVSSWLTSSTFTVRLKDTSRTLNWWDVDCVLLHVWSDGEYNATVEFEGASNAETWQNLNWTLDAAVSNASVSVTYQLYNFTAGAYPTSGIGYVSYTSSGTPDTDELQWEQMNTTDCTDFHNGTNHWRLKVESYIKPSDMGNTTIQHEISLDWIQFTPMWFCVAVEAAYPVIYGFILLLLIVGLPFVPIIWHERKRFT